MGLFSVKCSKCDKSSPKKELVDGVCQNCREILSEYREINALLYKMTGKTLDLTEDVIVKASKEELKQVVQQATTSMFGSTPKGSLGFTFVTDPGITLEAMKQGDMYHAECGKWGRVREH